MIASLPDAPALLCDRSGRIVRANDAAGALAGRAQGEDLVGASVGDLLTGEEPDLRLYRKDAPSLPVRAVRWRVPGTGLDAVLLTDISDLVERTGELRAERRRFADAQALAALGWWEFDHGTHRTTWSDSLYWLVGVEPGSVRPCLRTMLRLVHPDDAVRARLHWRRHQVDGDPVDIELRIVRADGAVRWVHAIAAGRVPGGTRGPVTGYARDVTVRHTAVDDLANERVALLDAQRIARLGSFRYDVVTGAVHRSEVLDEMYAEIDVDPGDDLLAGAPARYLSDMDRLRDQLTHATIDHPIEFQVDGVAGGSIHSGDRSYVVRARAKLDPDGAVTALEGTVQDVTRFRLLELQLLEDRRRFDDAQRAARLGAWEWDPVTDHAAWSPMLYELFGVTPGTPVTHRTFREMIHPQDLPWVDDALGKLVRDHIAVDFECRMIRPDGVVRTFRCNGVPPPSGRDSGVLVGTAQDITEQRLAETRMLRSSQRFTDLVALTPVGIGLFDESDRLVDANDALCDLLGTGLEKLRGRTTEQLTHPDDRVAYARAREEIRSGTRKGTYKIPQQVLVRADGEPVYCELHVAMSVQDNGQRFWLVVFQDITERRRIAESLRHQATHDELTGLPNRAAVKELLGRLLSGSDAPRVAVLFCDIDNFKRVNDSLGHDAGDELLVALARRLEGGLPEGCTVARLSGDEYVIICADIHAAGGVDTLANRVSSLLRTAVPVHGQLVRVTATIGAAVPNGGPTTGPDLLRFADAAMFEAKKRGGGRVALASASLIASADRQVHLEGQLRDALANDGLVLHFQPVVGPDGVVQTAEALTRWPHPDRGLLAPNVFLPVAEQGGLLRELDRWVLRTALREAASWPTQNGRPVAVAVNLAGLVPGDPEFVDIVANAVLESGIDWDRVVLELVETSLIDLPSRTLSAMADLVGRGVRFAVDDFGTGYSSLARLKDLPAQIIKVDRRFVSGVGSDSSDFAVASAVVDMSRAMGRSCVAEGVETATQFHVLRGMGVDAYQGWLFSKAVPVRELRALLTGGPLRVPTGG